MNKEKFPFEIEEGAVMDYVDGRFMLVVKDDFWNEEQLALLKEEGLQLTICATNGLVIFVLEGGPIDSCDLYFNIQECDLKDEILASEQYPLEVLLVDENSDICWKKEKLLAARESAILKSELEKQNAIEFMPGEYDVNVEGMMAAYQPFELEKFAKCQIRL